MNDPADPIRAQLFAALVAAHAELSATPNGLLVTAWERRCGDPDVWVVFGGRPHFPPAGPQLAAADAPAPLLFPPGSIGEGLNSKETLHRWAELPAWVRCAGELDSLWTSGPDQPLGRQPRGGFDHYVAHLSEPFVWLVVAEPLPPAEVDGELLALETRIPGLRRKENSALGGILLERALARYRELSRARPSGVWRVHVLVGGATAAAARRAAVLLCGASALDDLPYALAPHPMTEPVEVALDATAGSRSAFAAPSELLTALARPPGRELPGIRLTEPVDFDLTPEVSGPIVLGDILDDRHQPVGRFSVSLATLNRHTFVAGATGAGKSQTVRHLLEQLHRAQIPWLVIEPAKAEYARMAGRIGGDRVTVIHPGDPDAVAVGLNPLEPEPGFPLQTHIDLVRALFQAAFEAYEPLPQVLSQSLVRCYQELGWDTMISISRLPGVTPKYPGLGDLQRTARAVVDAIGYGKEVADNVRGFIDIRIGSLRYGTPGRFFEGGRPLDLSALLRHNVVLEIEDVGNDQDKAFFIGAVLIRLYEHLRTRQVETGPGLRHVTVVEEAHRLLRRLEPGNPAAHAVELFTALLAEVRAYGEGMIIAEQIPQKITADVIKNTALKVVHRLPARDDRDAVGATMNLTEAQSRHVVSLPPGLAAVFADSMDRPLRIAVPLGEHRETSLGVSHDLDTIPVPGLACGPLCRIEPCSMRAANQGMWLAEDPLLILWIELLTAAHLVGRPAPDPDRDWLGDLADRGSRRTVECAVAHRVRAAIDSRYSGLARHYQPESLAAHLADVVLGRLDDTVPPCDGTETQWQAGCYRWNDVIAALLDPVPPVDRPHPDTGAWAVRGLRLNGRTQDEQLAELEARPDVRLPSPEVISGRGMPPVYATAVAQLSQLPDPEDRFHEATAFLNLTTDWPIHVFAIADPEVTR